MSMDWIRYIALAEQIAAALQQAKAQGKAGVFQIILKPADHPADPDEIVVATLTV